MRTVEELREEIDKILKMDRTQRDQQMRMRQLLTGASSQLGPLGEAGKMIADSMEMLTETTTTTFLEGALIELGAHDSPEALKAICRVFRSNIVAHRLLAITALSTMSIPAAGKAIARRASFWSFASKEEKELAKSVLSAGG